MSRAEGSWWSPHEGGDAGRVVERLGEPPREVRSHPGERGRRAMLLLLWLIFGGVAVLGVWRVYALRSAGAALHREGVVTEAQVVDKAIERPRKYVHHAVVYRFEAGGKSYTDRWYRAEEEWRRFEARTLTVTYLPSNPAINAVGDVARKPLPPMARTQWLSVVLALAVAGAVTVALLGKELATIRGRAVARRWRARVEAERVVFVHPAQGDRTRALAALQPFQVRTTPSPYPAVRGS